MRTNTENAFDDEDDDDENDDEEHLITVRVNARRGISKAKQQEKPLAVVNYAHENRKSSPYFSAPPSVPPASSFLVSPPASSP